MKMTELAQLMDRLAAAYPGGSYRNADTLREWHRAFKDSTATAMGKAIDEYITNNKYAPHISDIKSLTGKYEPVEARRLNRQRVKEGNFQLLYEPAIGYRDNPISNVWENVETDPKKPPVYEERRPYPAYPWKFAQFEKIGDGKDSVFIPITEPVDHKNEDAAGFWEMAQLVGKVMENIPAPDIEGYRREKK